MLLQQWKYAFVIIPDMIMLIIRYSNKLVIERKMRWIVRLLIVLVTVVSEGSIVVRT